MESVVPVVDTENFLNRKGDYLEDCRKVIKAFEETGCLIIRDPRVNQSHNDEVLSMMEKFFDTRSKKYYKKEPVNDIFPQYSYQVGATPELKERARTHCELAEKMTGDNKPMTECPPPLDAKWRYFWKMGEKHVEEDDTTVNPPQHVPDDFPEWEDVMNRWGSLLLEACFTVARMLAVGLDFSEETFTEKMKKGAHLLAPTGSDLSKYDVGTIFAGFHYDFNFLSIHGKSRFPGLYIWLKDGTRVPVFMPDGCLLLQAGKQLEYLTGGFIKAGFHEVIYTEKTKLAKDKAVAEGRIPWRISSTLFSHIRSNVILEPEAPMATEEAKKKYPSILAKEQVINELRAINLLVE
jgi:isopenicillin N synthase-like dioxygenase